MPLLSMGELESGGWILSPIPVPSVFWPHPRVMAVSWVLSSSELWVCGTRMSDEGVAVGECSIISRGGDEAGSGVMADSCVGWYEEVRAAISSRACGSMFSTLWSPKTFERGDFNPGIGVAVGFSGSGAFTSCMFHMFMHPRASRAWGKLVSGVDYAFADIEHLV